MKSLKNHLESLGHNFNQNDHISINIIRMFLRLIYLEVGRGENGNCERNFTARRCRKYKVFVNSHINLLTLLKGNSSIN